MVLPSPADPELSDALAQIRASRSPTAEATRAALEARFAEWAAVPNPPLRSAAGTPILAALAAESFSAAIAWWRARGDAAWQAEGVSANAWRPFLHALFVRSVKNPRWDWSRDPLGQADPADAWAFLLAGFKHAAPMRQGAPWPASQHVGPLQADLSTYCLSDCTLFSREAKTQALLAAGSVLVASSLHPEKLLSNPALDPDTPVWSRHHSTWLNRPLKAWLSRHLHPYEAPLVLDWLAAHGVSDPRYHRAAFLHAAASASEWSDIETGLQRYPQGLLEPIAEGEMLAWHDRLRHCPVLAEELPATLPLEALAHRSPAGKGIWDGLLEGIRTVNQRDGRFARLPTPEALEALAARAPFRLAPGTAPALFREWNGWPEGWADQWTDTPAPLGGVEGWVGPADGTQVHHAQALLAAILVGQGANGAVRNGAVQAADLALQIHRHHPDALTLETQALLWVVQRVLPAVPFVPEGPVARLLAAPLPDPAAAHLEWLEGFSARLARPNADNPSMEALGRVRQWAALNRLDDGPASARPRARL